MKKAIFFSRYLLLEPFHGLVLGYLVRSADMSFSSFSLGYIESWTTKHHIEIHAVNTNSRVILDTKINMFLNSKAKVT